MATLTLPLKGKWFNMIKSCEKKEEYRRLSTATPHDIDGKTRKELYNMFRYEKLLIEGFSYENAFEAAVCYRHYDTLVFTLAYPKADDMERRLVFKNPRIRIGEGRPEWGAEPGKLYFVITWEIQ